ncbi:L,D-transpeptidase [Nocardioides sp. zg-536]|uniref:L,D-transpeptidase n=1 Tax=Nocardioides faecalis TaxID=2803858 RepID=A0A939BW61_9ACTN|nr:L,D-transpeptidase [Nocardioides faecalis]MBM9460691.1 L,D-transpeptidase [Nocardioides faecalis]MBS4752630.1 L,D-transpeptidase [Nocardioides faecalis]QVI57897.1 L,D-transpeptidase [Nocardioides faecalis]
MKHVRERPGRHRDVRPRYGRMAVLASCVAVTAISLAGSLGLVPGAERSEAASSVAGALSLPTGTPTPSPTPSTTPTPASPTPTPLSPAPSPERLAASAESTALPPQSGQGRRVVFSESRQRVWLVGADERVRRTYLGSGSVYDNLEPGTYKVFSRSRHAVGIDDSGTMEYFVRFTYGTGGAAIGFHTIPVADGEPVQTRAQLGTPLSHGCIRQERSDAIALWEFAPLGTTVVVTP